MKNRHKTTYGGTARSLYARVPSTARGDATTASTTAGSALSCKAYTIS